jgi:hypothetical protein
MTRCALLRLCQPLPDRCSALAAQDISLAASDAPGFVFAGERLSSSEVLPHSVLELRHTLVAHAAGWQPLPEMTVTALRYGARLTATSSRDSVCVRPPARGT